MGEKRLTISSRFNKAVEPRGKIAWDSNEMSLDGFNPAPGWIRADLKELYHTHRTYELKRKRLQKLASKKPSLRSVLEKYSKKERNRANDFVQKLTTSMAREFSGYVHGFENLNKEDMFTKGRSHNRRVAKSDWKAILRLMGYKASVKLLNPYNSKKRCFRYGMINAPKGAPYECSYCGLRINRQFNASINLQMEGLSPSQRLFDGLMKAWSGFTQTGDEADEGSDELGRSLRLMDPQNYVCLLSTT